jgi:glycosyltransferase EpsF
MATLPKRILIVLPNLDLGGMETVVMNYFRNTDRKQLVFDFAVHGEKGFFEDEAIALGAKIHRAPTRSDSFFKNISAMRKIYREYDFAIVCTEHAFAFIELAAACLSGVKTRAAWSHFSDYQGRSRIKRQLHFFARPFLRLFTNLHFACTKDAGRWLFGNKFVKNLHKKNFHIINNAVDLNKFRFDPAVREKLRGELGIGNKLAIGIIGRLVPVKNHVFALSVFEEILKTRDAVLLIIGDGELRAELEAKSNGHVIFTGAVGNINEYYQALDLLLVPSFHEGFPMIAIEAQAAGLSAVLSDTITRTVAVSDSASFLSLEAGAKAWANEILNLKHERKTVDLSDSGYCIKKEAERVLCLITKEDYSARSV